MARREGRLSGRPAATPARRDGQRGGVRAHLPAAPARVPDCRYVPPSLPPWVPGRVRVPGPWDRRRCPPGPAACGMLRSPSSWHLPRSAVSPRNFKLRNSPLISYMLVVVINFCRRWCPPGGGGLARVAGLCSPPRHRRAELRGSSLGTAAAASRVPRRPASSGKAWERGGFRACPPGRLVQPPC